MLGSSLRQCGLRHHKMDDSYPQGGRGQLNFIPVTDGGTMDRLKVNRVVSTKVFVADHEAISSFIHL